MVYKTGNGYSISYSANSDSNAFPYSHPKNQDKFTVNVQSNLFAVADGMGGYGHGEMASGIAIKRLQKEIYKIPDFETALRSHDDKGREMGFQSIFDNVNKEVVRYAKKQGYRAMGTTMSAVKLFADKNPAMLVAANVGDSPILLFRERKVLELYVDDSDRQSGDKYTLNQFLGLGKKTGNRVHMELVNLLPEDAILIATDGITDNLPATGKGSLNQLITNGANADRLVEAALKTQKKRDDMTAVLVRVLRD